MNRAQEAIADFYEEVLATIKGADYQAKNREEMLDMIMHCLENDKEKMMAKYND